MLGAILIIMDQLSDLSPQCNSVNIDYISPGYALRYSSIFGGCNMRAFGAEESNKTAMKHTERRYPNTGGPLGGCVVQRDVAMFAFLIDRYSYAIYLPFPSTQKYNIGL